MCRECKQTGHKEETPSAILDKNSKEKNSDTHSRGARTDGKAKGEGGGDGKFVDRPKKDDRGTSVRQTTLRSTLDPHSTRSRTETPKRRRSGEGTSPTTVEVQKRAVRGHGANVRNLPITPQPDDYRR